MNDRPFLPRLAVTIGEPAGIGPELVAALAATDLGADLIAIGDKDSLLLAAQTRGIALQLEADDGQWRRERAAGSLRYVHIPAPAPIVPGRLDGRNAPYVVAMLARLNPLGVVPAAIFLAAVMTGAEAMSRATGVPAFLSDVIQGTALLAMLVALLFTAYRIRRVGAAR